LVFATAQAAVTVSTVVSVQMELVSGTLYDSA
jgi:hypothetical protein